MDITLKVCENEKEWEDVLESCPNSTIFHKWKFIKIMEKYSKKSFLGKTANAKLYPLIAVNGGESVGLFPLFFYNTPFIRYVFSPPLFTAVTYQGPLITKYDKLKQKDKEFYSFEMQRKIDEYASKKLKAHVIKIRTAPNISDCRSFVWAGYNAETWYNYEIDLEPSLDDIWNSIEKTSQRNIKKSIKDGLVVTEGTEEDLNSFFSNLSKRYSEQEIPIEINKDYLFEIYNALKPENLTFLVVKKGDEYLSGILLLSYQNKIVGWIGLQKTDAKGVYPNDLLLWEVIKWGKNNRFKNFEITWANNYRLCRYKSKFNPKASPYFSCEKYSRFVGIFYQIKDIKKKLFNYKD